MINPTFRALCAELHIARWLTLLTPWRTIRQLEREVARLEAIIANPYLAGLEIGRETGIEVGCRGSGPQLLAGMFAGLLEKDGANAPNYLEVEFHTHSQGRILVRVQRLDGETPHALRVKAQQRAAAWEALCAELVDALAEWQLGGGPPEDTADPDLIVRARAALARWGRPAIEPVPVSERLPEPEDCDAEGRCWFGTPSGYATGAIWTHRKAEQRRSWDTHWLPYWALPVPGVEGKP